MLNTLINWLVSALVVLAIAYVLPGISVESFWVALVVALVLGLINAIIKPIAVFLTLPIYVLTLGFFTFVIDALLVMLAGYVVPGFEVSSFWWALLFALILSIVNGLVKGK